MTTRVYLALAQFLDQPPEPGDLPVERVFVNASEVSEVWVETESPSVPNVGRVASFALARPLEIGFCRVIGTVERRIQK
jgi:hypothetical protein